MTKVAVRPRIERARSIPVRVPLRGRPPYEGSILALEAEGLVGLGEAPATPGRGPGPKALQRSLAEAGRALVEGCDPGPLPAAVAAAVETALLDLRARAAGVRLAELLGGVRRTRVACNLLVGAVSPAGVAEEVEEGAREGFDAFKLKSAAGSAGLDLERLGAARWAAGPARALRLDLAGALSPVAAGARLPALAGARLELLEQPISAAEPLEAWRRLAGAGVKLAADESLREPSLAAGLAAGGVGLAVKLATVGGPQAAVRLAAAAVGPVLLSSSFETSVGVAAALHAACAVGPQPLACGLATRRLLEGDPAAGLGPCGPWLELPSGAGLGVEIDARVLDRYRRDA